MNNMGAYYGDEKNWETVRKAAFEAALTRTDVVVQPRQSNTGFASNRASAMAR